MPSLARSWWSRIEPDDARERITDVNDGIVAVAGMGLGLAGAEVSAATSYMVISVSTLVGAMSVFGAKLGESFADREAQQATVDYERSRIERTPEEEIAELADWFEAKGVTPQTARAVAEELSEADALSAQLEIEYGIRDLTTPSDAWQDGLWAGLAFVLGALVPLLIAVLVPINWRSEWTILAATLALILTSVVLSVLGRSRIWMTIARSVIVGLGTLGVSYALGDWLL
ncbi:VIT1/CCC1 transporter family protein [Gordonia bronchialis]|uniref:VIT1/CCC1 transporter family protein n=1 Tax=Gordonia bronchialis TaxID=2054 RepID=UPI001CC0FD59|nr:VIT1/CCC1 transporter family protein [Gordonia bronchialis]UAK36335.1 VIT1/CCC1 transporter family protein [Gordonia bronchialis]